MFESCPYSKNALSRLGKAIRDDTAVGDNTPSYGDVMPWYSTLGATVVEELNSIDWRPILGETELDVNSRPKTLGTLADKLKRLHDIALPKIRDVAGARFQCKMRIDQQDQVVAEICRHFEAADIQVDVSDMRDNPHSGYRAVHLVLNPPAAAPIEIQVRTDLQGRWANLYEAVSDHLGRGIRYGQPPDDKALCDEVVWVQELSTELVYVVEKTERGIFELQSEPAVANSAELGELKAMHDETYSQLEASFAKYEALVKQPDWPTAVRALRAGDTEDHNAWFRD